MKTLKWTSLVLFVSLGAAAQEKAPEVVTKEATGEAAIVGKDEQKAFDQAVKAALQSAVEQVAGVVVEAQTQTLENVLVRDQVVAHTAGYVKSYDVVSKKKEKGVYSVTVSAKVGLGEISRDVQAARALVRRFGRPSLVIMLQEQTVQFSTDGKGGVITNSDTTATVLTQQFKSDGWDIKDPAFAMGKVRIAPGATLGPGEAKEIGDLSKANYILYGTVAIKQQDPANLILGGARGPSGEQLYFPVSGEFDLALFATDTGTQIGKFSGKLSMSKDGKTVSPTVSYERTAFDVIKLKKDEIVGPMRGAALEYFRSRETNGAEYEVAVSGLGNYGTSQQFKKAVETLKGIKEVQQRDFKGGVANYRVNFTGSTAQLAEALEAAVFQKRKIEVTEVTDTRVALSVSR